MLATRIASPVPWLRRVCFVTTYSEEAATLTVVFGWVTQCAAVRIRFGAITDPPQK